VLTLSFSLFPLLCLGTSIYYQYRQAYKENVIESIRSRVQNRGSHLQTFMDERIAQLTSIAQTHSRHSLQSETYLNVILQALLSHSDTFVDLGIIDQDGSHVAYVGPYAAKLKTVNYSQEKWFRETMLAGVFVSDVMLGFREVPHIFIAIRRTEGEKTWILRATINSETIERIVQRGQIGKNGDAFVINRDNVLQTTPRFAGKLLQAPAAPDFSSSRSTDVQEVRYDGTAMLFATSPLSTPKWVLVVREDLQENLMPLLHARHLEFVIMAAGILLIIAGTVLAARSITNTMAGMESEKDRREDLAVQSSKMAALGKMAAGIAHEINNPLQVIKELLGLMKDYLGDGKPSEEDLRQFGENIRKVERQLERCKDITHRMLRFGRRMEPQSESCDLNSVLSETIGFLVGEAEQRDIDIQTRYGEDLPRLTIDVTNLQQALLNILDNAIDAIDRSGQIQVETGWQKESGRVFIRIKDTGCGIPGAMLPRIFDPFYTTKSPKQGIGLGLSVSYRIVEQLNGTISVESKEGQGTTFTVLLPCDVAPLNRIKSTTSI
jgi:two-component system NtrC family sensor kinase